jgi:uncharacterized membrane protein
MKYVEDQWAFDGRNRVLAIAVGLSPIWLLLLALLTGPPSWGGGRWAAVFAVAGLLTLAGAVVLWRARSTRVAVAAVSLLTLPALIVPIFGPALILVLRNVTTGR